MIGWYLTLLLHIEESRQPVNETLNLFSSLPLLHLHAPNQSLLRPQNPPQTLHKPRPRTLPPLQNRDKTLSQSRVAHLHLTSITFPHLLSGSWSPNWYLFICQQTNTKDIAGQSASSQVGFRLTAVWFPRTDFVSFLQIQACQRGGAWKITTKRSAGAKYVDTAVLITSVEPKFLSTQRES